MSKNLSISEIDEYFKVGLTLNVRRLRARDLNKLKTGLEWSITKFYGTYRNYCTEYATKNKINLLETPYITVRWSKELIISQIKYNKSLGNDMSLTAVRKHAGFLDNCLKLFGSYKNAVESSGFEYETAYEDPSIIINQGRKFEAIVSKILIELNINVVVGGIFKNGCFPDFHIGSHWIDAKLSEWSTENRACKTIEKYLPHCRRLSIIYLRGYSAETYRTDSQGVDFIHVSELLKELPADRAEYYQIKLDEILSQLKES